MFQSIRLLKDNRSGFTFVELLVVIVIMAVLVAASANYLFSQGGSKARDAERKNELKQVAALIEQFVASYGEPPSSDLQSKKAKRITDCSSVTNYQQLLTCFEALDYVAGEGVMKLREDPKQGTSNDANNTYQYFYGADSNGWKICSLLENQTDPDINANYQGEAAIDQLPEKGQGMYCLVASNRSIDQISPIAAGAIPE